MPFATRRFSRSTSRFFAIVVTFAASGAFAADPLVGIWEGRGTQYPPGRDPSWSIVMTINASDGAIQYPSLSCGGTLTQLSRDGNSAQFRETITYGKDRCIDGGTITVRLASGRLSWVWHGVAGGTQYDASADVTAELVPRPSTAGGPR